VHFPSDILAGWAAATAWVVAMYQLTVTAPPPPASAAPRKDTITPAGAPVSAAPSRD
jgi:membrane-associated phospholipid phosphatase